jgi:lauroyl/myristoyl acyltransferase
MAAEMGSRGASLIDVVGLAASDDGETIVRHLIRSLSSYSPVACLKILRSIRSADLDSGLASQLAAIEAAVYAGLLRANACDATEAPSIAAEAARRISSTDVEFFFLGAQFARVGKSSDLVRFEGAELLKSAEPTIVLTAHGGSLLGLVVALESAGGRPHVITTMPRDIPSLRNLKLLGLDALDITPINIEAASASLRVLGALRQNFLIVACPETTFGDDGPSVETRIFGKRVFVPAGVPSLIQLLRPRVLFSKQNLEPETATFSVELLNITSTFDDCASASAIATTMMEHIENSIVQNGLASWDLWPVFEQLENGWRAAPSV